MKLFNKTNVIVSDCDIGLFLKNVDLKLQPIIQIIANSSKESSLSSLHSLYLFSIIKHFLLQYSKLFHWDSNLNPSLDDLSF